jgi:hypothetical protein
MVEARIEAILASIANVNDDLLSLSDDLWLSIEHNDSDAVRQGAELKVAYNDAVTAFARASAEVARLLQERARSEASPRAGNGDRVDPAPRQRIVRGLDMRQAHSLTEDFRYKRPYAFVIEGGDPVEASAWQQVYEGVWRQLATKDPRRAAAVPDAAAFTSSRGNRYFSRSQGDLRDGRKYWSDIWVEVNLSANQIRDNIARLLDHFGLPHSASAVYLREDRDAAE